MDIKYIGKNIVKLRLSRELSQADLGKEIGLTPSAISNIENSISYPSVDTLIRFADYFSVSMDYLLTDKGVKQLEELQPKSKLLTAEMFLRAGKLQKGLYEIGNKKYINEESQKEVIYKVAETDIK